MKDETELEAEVVRWLDEIKPVPARDGRLARRARAVFVNQAVSASEQRRHRGWTFKFRKEPFVMNALIAVFVIAGLLFGGGATVRAAQNDLPGEPLYGLKLWSEDVSLGFQKDDEAKVERLMELAQGRVQEMAQIHDAGKAVPDQVRLRLEQHIRQALQICSTMDDAALDWTLLRVRDRLREQDRDMEQLQLRIHQESQPVLERTREMLRLRLQLVEDGLLDHEMFRNTVRNGFRHGQDDDFTPPAPGGNGQPNGSQTGQPTWAPGGPNSSQATQMPGGPNTAPGGPNPGSDGMNSTPGGSNTSPGGPNPDSGGNMNGSGPGPGGNMNDSGGSGGGGYGGNDSGGGGGGNGP